jgi:hypothetical protein
MRNIKQGINARKALVFWCGYGGGGKRCLFIGKLAAEKKLLL